MWSWTEWSSDTSGALCEEMRSYPKSQISLATGVRDLRKMESEEKEDAEEGDSFGKETGKRTYERGLESRMYRCRAGSFSARWRVIVSATLFLAEQSRGVRVAYPIRCVFQVQNRS